MTFRCRDRVFGLIFLGGWLAFCAAAFAIPFVRTQIDLARTYGTQGLIGSYYLRAGAGADVVHVDSSLAPNRRRNAITNSRRFTLEWEGELRIDEAGDYRFFGDTPNGTITVKIGDKTFYAHWNAVDNLMRLQSDPIALTTGWYPLKVSWASENNSAFNLLWSHGALAPATIPAQNFRFRPKDADRARRFLHGEGGVDGLAEFFVRSVPGRGAAHP